MAMASAKLLHRVLIPLIILATISIIFIFLYPRWHSEISAHFGTVHYSKLYLATNQSSPSLLKGYPLSKDVVIHSVHYDNRSRNGHTTIILFLLDVKLDIFKNNWIMKCGSEQHETNNFKVHEDREDILMHYFFGPKPYPYVEVVLECYDLVFKDGDHGFVWYKIDENDSEDLLVTSSEEQIVLPAPRIKPLSGQHNISVLTCTKIDNKGVTYVSEFLRYQETIGIDHVHIMVLDTFIKDGGFQKLITTDSYVKNAIRRNYVSIGIWREWYETRELYLHGKSLEQMDCYYRYRGTYDYVFPLDTDDFFNPLTPGLTNIKDYILKWCHGPGIGSCVLKWITYYPEACGLTTKEIPEDGNITKYLKSHANRMNGNPKSIHLTNALIDCSFHDAKCEECMIDGFRAVDIPVESAYIAHIRNGQQPKDGC